MIRVLGLRSDDDPPIVGLFVTGDDPARELSAWLSEQKDVRRVVLEMEEGTMLHPDEVERLSWHHGVGIRVRRSEGSDDETGAGM